VPGTVASAGSDEVPGRQGCQNPFVRRSQKANAVRSAAKYQKLTSAAQNKSRIICGYKTNHTEVYNM